MEHTPSPRSFLRSILEDRIAENIRLDYCRLRVFPCHGIPVKQVGGGSAPELYVSLENPIFPLGNSICLMVLESTELSTSVKE
jgi:hypothetical protein